MNKVTRLNGFRSALVAALLSATFAAQAAIPAAVTAEMTAASDDIKLYGAAVFAVLVVLFAIKAVRRVIS